MIPRHPNQCQGPCQSGRRSHCHGSHRHWSWCPNRRFVLRGLAEQQVLEISPGNIVAQDVENSGRRHSRHRH